MKLLEEKILSDGSVINNEILKVDSFLNYKIDLQILKGICKFIANHFSNVHIDKVLTVETSGLPFAIDVAMELGNIDVVFAKKSESYLTINDDNYSSLIHSFTHGIENNIYVRKSFINPNENVLIVDDFLAKGSASLGLINICKQANANVKGVAVAIEKEFQGGRKKITESGIPVVSAARITGFKDNKPIFSKEEC